MEILRRQVVTSDRAELLTRLVARPHCTQLCGKLGQGGEISSEQREQYEFLEESKMSQSGYSLQKLLEKESLRKWLLEQAFLDDYKIKKTR